MQTTTDTQNITPITRNRPALTTLAVLVTAAALVAPAVGAPDAFAMEQQQQTQDAKSLRYAANSDTAWYRDDWNG